MLVTRKRHVDTAMPGMIGTICNSTYDNIVCSSREVQTSGAGRRAMNAATNVIRPGIDAELVKSKHLNHPVNGAHRLVTACMS